MALTANLPIAVPEAPSQIVKGGRPFFGAVAIAAISSMAFLFPLGVLGLVGPRFGAIFQDHGIALGSATRFLLQAANFLGSFAGILVIVMIGVLIFAVVAGTVRFYRALAGILLMLACLAWCMISLAIMFVAFWAPLISMVESLQQGGAV